MISGKLVHLILTREEEIIDRVLERIRRDPEMEQIRTNLVTGLHQWHRKLFENLIHWLTGGNRDTLVGHYQQEGREWSRQGIPLHECLQDLCMTREILLDFVEEHTLNKDSLELYAEEELDRRVGRFFDLLIVQLVRGYESAKRHSAAA